MARGKKKQKVDRKNLLNKRITVRITADDRIAIKRISERDGISKAEVMRTAFYDYYAKDLN